MMVLNDTPSDLSRLQITHEVSDRGRALSSACRPPA